MVNQNKNLLIVLVLVAAGAIILFLGQKQNSAPQDKVQMQNVFNQTPPSSMSLSKSSDSLSDPVPSPAIVTSPEHGQEAGFAVQVYSFKDQKRADSALENLKKNGYGQAYIEISDLGQRGTWYRVRISAKNEAQAKSTLEAIRKNFNSGIIVKSK